MSYLIIKMQQSRRMKKDWIPYEEEETPQRELTDYFKDDEEQKRTIKG